GVRAKLRGISQQRDEFQHLGERAGPAVRDDERERLRADAAFVNVMDLQAADIRAEMTEAVERRFLRAPVKYALPVLRQFMKVIEAGAVFPARAGQRVGPARECQPRLQIVQRGLRNVDFEGVYIHRLSAMIFSLSTLWASIP